MTAKDWRTIVEEYGIEVIAIYPERDAQNPEVFLEKGHVHVRVGKLQVELRALPYGRRNYGKQGRNKTRLYMKKFGELFVLANGEKLFVPAVVFLENNFFLWKAIDKLCLEHIKKETLPFFNKERYFPFEKLPDKKPPTPGRPCPENPWEWLRKKYGIFVSEIRSKTGIPLAGTKENGRCDVIVNRFKVQIRNIVYRSNPNWTARYEISWPQVQITDFEGKKKTVPYISFMENSRKVWSEIAGSIQETVAEQPFIEKGY